MPSLTNRATAIATIMIRTVVPNADAAASPSLINPASASPPITISRTGDRMHIITPVDIRDAALSLCSRNEDASSMDTLLTVSSSPLSTGAVSFVSAISISSLRR